MRQRAGICLSADSRQQAKTYFLFGCGRESYRQILVTEGFRRRAELAI
jgi:hypothetical protein